jgi:predicted extracellular nuclease
VEGQVVADFQGGDQLNGFFLQEEPGDHDSDDLTSEGVFVYDADSSVDVSTGDIVRVKGAVTEYFDLTEINNVTDVLICDSAAPAEPVPVSLPVPDSDYLERFEGMLVSFEQTLYVTENYSLGRFGEVDLAVGGRLFNPTHLVSPGTAALAKQAENDLRRIQLDDGSSLENPVPIPPYFASDGTLRAGDTTSGITAALGYAFGTYELHPILPVTFTRVNARPVSAPSVGGDLSVASFNVLNYFTTIDTGVPICGPLADQGCRGADSSAEFQRQRDKIIAALVTLDADIVGLTEIENHPDEVPLQDLVQGLNDVMGAGTYAYVATGPIGGDVIRVAFIYKPAAVSLYGGFAVLDASVDPTFNDDKNRPVLAQSFQSLSDGAVLTLAVNHLKSKGSPCDDVGDPDALDGQGNCNLTREAAAIALANWLASDPTGSGDPDYLIIGDLNSYAQEDPIVALEGVNYTDLLQAYLGLDAYSYVFFGQAGYLDHALANPALVGQVTGTAPWHINADEPSALDYNDYNQPVLYQPDMYRSSDHDAILTGLDLNVAPVCTEAAASVEFLWPVNHKFVSVEILGVTDADGDVLTITIESIFQDEAVDDGGDGSTAPDGQGVGSNVAELRAERAGGGNGRFYHVTFSAADGRGGTCSGTVYIGVPLNQGKQGAPVDDGPLYDSTLVP